jgi:hypothetical protein
VEKLKQEEERKIATLTRENKHKLITGPTTDALITSTNTQDDENILNNNIDDDGNHFETSEHDNDDDDYFNEECKINRNLIINQHRLIGQEEDDSSELR